MQKHVPDPGLPLAAGSCHCRGTAGPFGGPRAAGTECAGAVRRGLGLAEAGGCVGPAVARSPWALGLGADRWLPVRLWKVRVGRSSAPRRCGDAWAGPDLEGVTRGFVSRVHPGTPSGGGGCGPGPGGILLRALLPRKFPEVLLRLFQLVLKEPSPIFRLLQLWPGERRSEMEREPENGEPAEIKIIKEAYEKAFMFVNKGLNTDELGQKEEAKNYYKQGIGHLLRGISIAAAEPGHTGPAWEAARQMQQKMKETLQNVRTRLEILEKGLATSLRNDLQDVPKLYPEFPPKDACKKSPEQESVSTAPQRAEVDGSASAACAGPSGAPSALPVPSPSCPAEAPPAYSPQAAEGHYTVSYGTDSGEFSSVGEDFYRNRSQPPPLETLGLDADELILIPNGVQIFFVNPAGEVSAPSYPGYLRIVRFLDNSLDTVLNRPPGFLQVCDWLYPLVPDRSPVLKCTVGAYMFPDTMLQAAGCFVGVVLSSELPEDDRELFEDLLRQMSDLRLQANWNREEDEFQIPGRSSHPSEPPKEASGTDVRQSSSSGSSIDQGSKDARHKGKRGKKTKDSSEEVNLSQIVPCEPSSEEKSKELPEWSEKVAHNILSGASWVSWGLVKGAEFTGKAIQKGASKLRERIQPEEKPVEVSPAVTRGLYIAKQATGGAAKVSQLLVDGVCTVANCVGKELAPHVKKHGSKLVPESLKRDKDGKSALDGAMVVAASSVQGFSTVWQGLECAAKCIVNNVSAETVQTVRYKYGHNAGEATHNAVDSAINVGLTAYNIDNIGIKAMVKKTAKQTGHTLLEDYQIVERPQRESQGGATSTEGRRDIGKQVEEEKPGAGKKDK